jgi:hypothetical protein
MIITTETANWTITITFLGNAENLVVLNAPFNAFPGVIDERYNAG